MFEVVREYVNRNNILCTETISSHASANLAMQKALELTTGEDAVYYVRGSTADADMPSPDRKHWTRAELEAGKSVFQLAREAQGILDGKPHHEPNKIIEAVNVVNKAISHLGSALSFVMNEDGKVINIRLDQWSVEREAAAT